MFKGVSFIAFLIAGREQVISPRNLAKEIKKWKGKYDVIVYEQTQLQGRLLELQKEVKRLFRIKKELDTHDTPSKLATKVSTIQASLRVKKRPLSKQGIP